MPLRYPPQSTFQTTQTQSPLAQLLDEVKGIKSERAQDQQIRRIIQGKPLRSEQYPEIKSGFAGIAGRIFDSLNPLAPYRETTGLEKLYAQKDVGLHPLEKDLLGSRAEYYRQPRYASKVRTGAVVSKEMDDLLRSLTVLQNSPLYEEGEFSGYEQLLIKLLEERRSEMLDLEGMEVKETIGPGTPAKESWMPFGIGDKPAVPGASTFELVPKSSGGGMGMGSPVIAPTSEDLELYRRMGVKQYTSPSGRGYPVTRPLGNALPSTFTGPPAPKPFIGPPVPRRKVESKVTPVKPGLDAIAGEMFGTAKEPRQAKTEQTFDKYPEPKTVKEFNNIISRIPSKEMKIRYFEAMIERIKDDKLAAEIYKIWIDELYE